jgi:glycine dehydrogenase
VYHGPEGLRNIARRTHRYASLLAEGLSGGGVEIVHDDFFDTVTARVPGRAAGIVRAARQDGVNLRLVDADHVGISCDETTTRDQLGTVWTAFGVSADAAALDAARDDTAGGPDGAAAQDAEDLPATLLRTDEYLTHQVFHRYRSDRAP